MEIATITALTIAGFITPWIVQFVKNFLPTLSRFWITVLVGVISLVVSVIAIWYEGLLNFTDVPALFVTLGFVFGVATAVYNVLQKTVIGTTGAVTKRISK